MAVGLFALAATGVPAQANTALVGYWKMDDGAGVHVTDSSGYGNDGTLAGEAAWTAGISGSALSFDGSGYVRVPDNSSLEPPLSVSVGAWVRHVGTPGEYRYVIAKGAAVCTAASYGLYTGPNGGLEFYVSRQHGAVYARSPDAGQRVWDGNWHLAVGTFNGTTVRLYVDGVEVGSGTRYPGYLEYPLATSNDLFIGDYPGCTASGFGFTGDLDDVSVWSQALSAAEIEQMDKGNEPAPSSGARSFVGPSSLGQSSVGQGSSQQAGSGAGPALKLLAIEPSRFSAARSGTRNHSTGTTVSYVDSEAGLSTLTVLQRQIGFEKAGRCRRQPPGARAKPEVRCALYVSLGSFTHRDHPGLNRFHFNGQIRGRRLTPGVYLLDVVTHVAGVRSRTASVAFSIVR